MSSSGICFLMRVLLHVKENNQEEKEDNFGALNLVSFKESVSSCLNIFLTSRKSVLTPTFFHSIFFQCPKVGWNLVPLISNILPEARYKGKIIAMEWLSSFLKMKKEMGPGGSRFLIVDNCFYNAFLTASKKENIQAPELRKTLNVLVLAVQASLRHQGLPKTQAAYPITAIQDHISSLPSQTTSKPSIHLLVNNIVSLLSLGTLPHQEGKKKEKIR